MHHDRRVAHRSNVFLERTPSATYIPPAPVPRERREPSSGNNRSAPEPVSIEPRPAIPGSAIDHAPSVPARPRHPRAGPAPLPGARAGLIALAVLLGGASAGLAQEEGRIDSPYRWRERGFRIGLFGGYHRADRGSLDFGQGPAPIGGARLRLRVSSPLSFETGVSYAPAERWVVDPREEGGPVIVDTVSAGWLRADIGGQLSLPGARTWNGVQPYAVFGGGFVFGVDEGASEVFADPALEPFRYDISVAPQIHVGAGIELFPSDRIGIGLEFRDYLIRLSAPDGFLGAEVLQNLEDAGAPAPDGSAWQHNLEFGVVLWYYF